MKRTQLVIFAAALALSAPASAQTAGSAGCAAITQAASNAIATRISVDDQNITQPTSVKSLSCLDNFFKGAGLNVVTNLLNPQNLLQSIQTQICNKINSLWNQTLGSTQCGITLTGLKLGFLGGSTSGGGISCPKLSFGGGGPPIARIGTGTNNSGGLYMSGNAVAPTGYPITSLLGLY
ncbi:hypothetical protein CCR94_02280 [Rhodoblastus sphagnicola]|uniref:Uncharacterized protein n=1 Tax=Rhodoblastus sphagnicola TaxID=333368 RepID=A0A2S6NFA1_9HYPH|nr:hypothetical protein [Rhodoblastus sphagnicola]MBB4200211.1 hypothetical protein [Rhodoblastus sphagnicola]PPQ33249.1 hypothetical protein CCR94_02280 [Rhodoblastus sphagnicola]